MKYARPTNLMEVVDKLYYGTLTLCLFLGTIYEVYQMIIGDWKNFRLADFILNLGMTIIAIYILFPILKKKYFIKNKNENN